MSDGKDHTRLGASGAADEDSLLQSSRPTITGRKVVIGWPEGLGFRCGRTMDTVHLGLVAKEPDQRDSTPRR